MCRPTETQEGGDSGRHKNNAKAVSMQKPANSGNDGAKAKAAAQKAAQIKQAEIRLALFMVEHNLPFRIADHLVELSKAVVPVANEMKCCRTKSRMLIKNVIGKYSHEQLVNALKRNKFCLIVDESTDRSSEKNLALIARICYDDFTVRDEFLALIRVTDETAAGFHRTITDYFKANDIDYKNQMIGFASDGPTVMQGIHGGLQKLLKDEIPSLFNLKCTCHSLALVVSYASEKLPKAVEELLRESHAYLIYSDKRTRQLKDFQDILDIANHKILRLFDARWLSLEACVKRFLEQYRALEMFFKEEASKNILSAAAISKKFTTLNYLYLLFLDYTLPFLTNLNLEFQSEGPKIYCLYSKVSGAYKAILSNYIKPHYLKDDDCELRVQFKNPEYFKELKDVYLGPKVQAAIANTYYNELSSKDINSFRLNCLHFYVECASQLYTRFPFSKSNVRALKELSFIEPEKLKETVSVAPTADYFLKEIDLNDIDRELMEIKSTNSLFEKKKLIPGPMSGNNSTNDMKKHATLDFWAKLALVARGDGEPAFPNMVKLAKHILALPHSSAAVERIFSSINLNKTSLRNRLITPTVEALMNTKNFIKNDAKVCYDMNIPDAMLKYHCNDMYDVQTAEQDGKDKILDESEDIPLELVI